MDLKEFAILAIETSEKLYEKKHYSMAAAKLEILKQEVEKQIKAIEKQAAKVDG